MVNEPDHIFWAQRYRYARALCRRAKHPYPGHADLAESNYGLYLTEVFSWIFEQRLKTKAKGELK